MEAATSGTNSAGIAQQIRVALLVKRTNQLTAITFFNDSIKSQGFEVELAKIDSIANNSISYSNAIKI